MSPGVQVLLEVLTEYEMASANFDQRKERYSCGLESGLVQELEVVFEITRHEAKPA